MVETVFTGAACEVEFKEARVEEKETAVGVAEVEAGEVEAGGDEEPTTGHHNAGV